MGLTDIPYKKSVKLYCGHCEDLYTPKSSQHGSINGVYFRTTFPYLLFLVYPTLIPPKSGPVELGRDAAGMGRAGTADGGRTRRRVRDEQVEVSAAEGGGEGINTLSATLKVDWYKPRIYGFQVNEIAKLQRRKEAMQDRQVGQLEALEERMP